MWHGIRLAGVLAAGTLLAASAQFLAAGCSVSVVENDTSGYSLRIDAPAAVSTTQEFIILTGYGFLPAGSTCPGGCVGPLPPPVFGTLGPYTFTWSNEATGRGGSIVLTWVCNCGGNEPTWMTNVPVAQGVNRITVTLSDRDRTQQAVVAVSRE
ncbi:MAG: hypothetical protein ACM3PU_03520 [Gemmatimonadota bacterium]